MKLPKRTIMNGAVVGIGGYGKTHLNCLDKLGLDGRVKLIAAVHTGADHEYETAEALREKGCALYLDADQMFREVGDQLDFCTLPTSIGSHVPLALKCLERNIHCLVEKPLTGDRSQLEELECAMKRHPEVLVTVGYQMLFFPEIIEARKRLAEGVLGALKSIRVFGAWPRPASYYKRNDWAGKVRTGDCTIYDSPLNNAMAHYLNLGLYWAASGSAGPVAVKSVEGSLYRAQAIENFDTASCRFHLEGCAPVGAWVTHSSREQIDITIQVDGEKGWMRWRPYEPLQWDVEGWSQVFRTAPRAVASLIQYQTFLDSISGFVRPECRNVQQAALQVRAILAMQESLSVQDVSPDIIRTIRRGDDSSTYIEGVEEILLSGFKKDQLVTLPVVPA